VTSIAPPTTRQMVIDGKMVDSSDGTTFDRRSPFDGSVLGTFPNGTAEDAEKGIRAARRTFDDGIWREAGALHRAGVLKRVASRLRSSAEEIGRRMSAEVGQPVGVQMALSAADYIEYYANQAADLRGEAITEQSPDAIGIIAKEPIGVVGIITPWNGPIVLAGWKVGAALAVGCSVVMKPAHLAPGTALDLAELYLEEGLPPGVFNVVTSETDNGALVGQQIAASSLVDMVSFTGSSAIGRKIMAAAAGNLKKVSLELGGKSPHIVFEDAHSLEAAVDAAYSGITGLAGQACQSGSRLLLQRSIQEPFVERLVDKIRSSVRLGDPLDPETTMGPLVSEGQFQRVLRYIESGKESSELVIGGGPPAEDHLKSGYFVEPTVFNNVRNDALIAREEIFGPVLSIIPFDDTDEAIALANDTMYGLASGVWTENINRALRVAKGIRAGTVWINTYRNSGLTTMPFGGYKSSGLGREWGREGLEDFLETKSIHIKLRPEPGK